MRRWPADALFARCQSLLMLSDGLFWARPGWAVMRRTSSLPPCAVALERRRGQRDAGFAQVFVKHALTGGVVGLVSLELPSKTITCKHWKQMT